MAKDKTVEFDLDRDAIALAKFLAELERQGIAYETQTLIGGVRIKITGY